MMKINNLIFLFLLMGFYAHAQERIVPLTGNTALTAKDFKSQKFRSHQMKSGDMVELPFIDDFSVDRFPGNGGDRQVLWTNRSASINTGWGKNPPTVGVVSLDGADKVGYPYDWGSNHGPADTLESCPINLDAGSSDGMGISFYYQPQGNNFQLTDMEDSLMLEFYAPDLDQWFHVWSTSDVSNPDKFTFVYIPIVLAKYLKTGFKFRFTNYAIPQGALSTWNLDYIWVDQNNTNNSEISNDVAFVRQEFTFLDGLSAMPRDHFAENPASHMRQSIKVLLRNLNDGPRTLEGNKIRILYDGTEIGSFANSNNPAIGFGENDTLSYLHTVAAPPNTIVFDPAYNDEQLNFDVQIMHDVSDFSATASNDTLHFTQSFFTNYAYDDGHAEAAYGNTESGGQVALRYTNFKSDSIFALQIYTMPNSQNYENSSFTIRIWEDTGDEPGELIGESQQIYVYGLDAYQQQWIYYFDEPIYVPSGSFYCGYKQTTQFEGMTVGLDLNSNFDGDNLRYTFNGSWHSTIYPGTVMIHPMFTSNGYGVISGVENPDVFSGLKIFPNPATTYFTVASNIQEPLNCSIFDIEGRKLSAQKLSQNGRVDISSLSNGVYIVILEDGHGNRSSRKLMVSH